MSQPDETRDAASASQRAIIIPPGKNGDHFGEGIYALVAEDGECIATHLCSAAGWAPHDLWLNRTERREEYAHKNITEVVWLADSGIALDELLRRNHEFAAEEVEPNV